MQEDTEKSNRDVVKDARRRLVRSACYALAALAVMAVAAYAWFARSQNAAATGMSASTTATRYTITTTPGTLSDGNGGYSVYEKDYENGNEARNFLTELTKAGLRIDDHMQVGADSNLLNHQALNLTLENGDPNAQLSPGASGKLEFTVIPYVTDLGDVTVSLERNFVFYDSTDAGNTQAEKLMSGHLLFFLEKTDEDGYGNWIQDSFTISKDQFCEGESSETTKPYSFTLYWVWPERFHNFYYTGTSSYYRNLFQSEDSADRKNLLADMQNHLDKYFDTTVTLDGSLLTAEGDLTGDAYTRFTRQYDLADEMIGNRIPLFQLRVNTEENQNPQNP